MLVNKVNYVDTIEVVRVANKKTEIHFHKWKIYC